MLKHLTWSPLAHLICLLPFAGPLSWGLLHQSRIKKSRITERAQLDVMLSAYRS